MEPGFLHLVEFLLREQPPKESVCSAQMAAEHLNLTSRCMHEQLMHPISKLITL